MPKALTVKRHGLGLTLSRKIPFRLWLNEQDRSELTYREVDRKEEKGWTSEDFALEACKRGVDVRVLTVVKWARGTQPREIRRALERTFPGVRF